MKVFSRFRRSTPTTTVKTTQNETTLPKSKATHFSSSNSPTEKERITRTLSSTAATTTTSTTDAEKKITKSSSASKQQTQTTLSAFLQRRQKSHGNRPSSSSLSSSSSSPSPSPSPDRPKRASIDMNPTRRPTRTSIDTNATKQRPKRTSIDTDASKQRPKRTSIELRSRKREPAPTPSVQMVKRRVVLPVSIFDKPMLTEVEFMIDARYRQVKVIGSGTFGVVASALDTRTGSKVAIKKVVGAFGSARSCRYALREVRLLRHMQHRNIVRLTDLDVPNDYRAWQDLYIITPLLHCDLRQAITDGRLKGDAKLQKRIAWSMINALRYMHAQGLMHRDIKSKNVLLNSDLSDVQLCDLGHSRFHSKSSDVDNDEEYSYDDVHHGAQEPDLTGAVGTMIQSAPEITLGCEYNFGVDIWSAACVISELVHSSPGETLFDNTSKTRHVTEIFQVIGYPTEAQIATLPDYVAWYLRVKCKRSQKYAGANEIASRLGLDEGDQVVDLLTKMLAFAAADRLSAAEVLQHGWFDEVRDECTKEDKEFDEVVGKKREERYDFALCEPPKKASKGDMKQLVWEEVVGMHPEAAPMR